MNSTSNSLESDNCKLCKKTGEFYFIPSRVTIVRESEKGLLGKNDPTGRKSAITIQNYYDYHATNLRAGYLYIIDKHSLTEIFQVYQVSKEGLYTKLDLGLNFSNIYSENSSKINKSCLSNKCNLGNSLLVGVGDIDNERDIYVFYSIMRLSNKYLKSKIVNNNDFLNFHATKIRVGIKNGLDFNSENYYKVFKKKYAQELFFSKPDSRFESVLEAINDKKIDEKIKSKMIGSLSIVPITDVVALSHDISLLVKSEYENLNKKYKRELFSSNTINIMKNVIIDGYETTFYYDKSREAKSKAENDPKNKVKSSSIGVNSGNGSRIEFNHNLQGSTEQYYEEILKDINPLMIKKNAQEYWVNNYANNYNESDFEYFNVKYYGKIKQIEEGCVDTLMGLYLSIIDFGGDVNYFVYCLKSDINSSNKIYLYSEFIYMMSDMLQYSAIADYYIDQMKNDLFQTTTFFYVFTYGEDEVSKFVENEKEDMIQFDLMKYLKSQIKSSDIFNTIKNSYNLLLTKLSPVIGVYVQGLLEKNNIGIARKLIQSITGTRFKVIEIQGISDQVIPKLVSILSGTADRIISGGTNKPITYSSKIKVQNVRLRHLLMHSNISRVKIKAKVVISVNEKYDLFTNLADDDPRRQKEKEPQKFPSYEYSKIENNYPEIDDYQEKISNRYAFDSIEYLNTQLSSMVSDMLLDLNDEISTGIGLVNNINALNECIKSLMNQTNNNSELVDLLKVLFNTSLTMLAKVADYLARKFDKVAKKFANSCLYMVKMFSSLIECVNILYYFTKASEAGSEGKLILMGLYLAKVTQSGIALAMILGFRILFLAGALVNFILLILWIIIDKVIDLLIDDPMQKWLSRCHFGIERVKFSENQEIERSEEVFKDLEKEMNKIGFHFAFN